MKPFTEAGERISLEDDVMRILSKRYFAVGLAAAICAWLVGASPWAASLIACNGPSCCGGCIDNVTMDGRYTNDGYCDIVQANVFGDFGQSLLARYGRCVVPGPNNQPVKDGMMVHVDGNPQNVSLPCNTSAIQVATQTQGTPQQLIPHTTCPHE